MSERETPVRTRTGAERLSADPTLAGPGRRLGLVTNYTGVMPDLSSDAAALLASGVPLVALFGPEHGLRGTAQAGDSEPDTHDPVSGLPLHDTYRSSGRGLDAVVAAAEVDTLLFDLQDIGTRFYTYVWTMYDLLASSARLGVRFVVLDRPNPVSGLAAEGPLLDRAYGSFVGRAPIPVRHGLTAGELARHLNATAIPTEVGQPADLSVVTMEGWHRSLHADETGLPWVMPSVNIPTLDSALAYPGTGLFEGTNLSEGRGTTRPFELIGAPYVDGRWAATLNDSALSGVRFREAWFTPTFHKYAGQPVRGVQLHVTDRTTFAPVRTALAMLHTLRTLYPCEFGWRTTAAGAGGTGHRHFIDLLWGSGSLRQSVDAGKDPTPLLALAGSDSPQHPAAWAGEEVLLYPDTATAG
ncbi:DUF1343 domain-containing protein [Actinopolymorpha sp. B17G11]|uniref:exo-beta-N-acetylmuramidase NamZ family protein n=1 Tax=Actinopolymorpha sp. B17G11 TaxID=3160861 RepID=UPI0032E3FB37